MLELFPQYTGIFVLILALIVIFRKYILRFAGRYVFLKPIANWAVQEAEKQVALLGPEKLRLATNLLTNRVEKTFKLDLPEDLIFEVTQGAWKYMVQNNLEIKKEDVLE